MERFYSQLIHKYRPYGHPYKHFTKKIIEAFTNTVKM